MARRRQRGFTLIELMVVVAIVGILAGIAMFMYGRYQRNARKGEIHAFMAEMRLKQEQHHTENGQYLSTGADETDMWPLAPTYDSPDTVAPQPASWDSLHITLSSSSLWCRYVVIAGPAGDASAAGPIGATMIPDPPPTNWWYGIAFCPFLKKTFVTKHNETTIAEF